MSYWRLFHHSPSRGDTPSDTALAGRAWKASSILEHFPQIGGEDQLKTLQVRSITTVVLGADKNIPYGEDNTVGGDVTTAPPAQQT